MKSFADNVSTKGFLLLFVAATISWNHGMMKRVETLESRRMSAEVPSGRGGLRSETAVVATDENVERKFRPLDCVQLTSSNEQAAAWSDPNKGLMYARRTVTDPPFYMSLSTQAYDSLRWYIFKNGDYYEKVMTKSFTEILRTTEVPQGKRKLMLDVGSNAGWFSLLSATLGYDAIAFDANPIHLKRICESNNINRFKDGQVLVYNYGVSDVADKTLTFHVPQNPGMGSFKAGTTNEKGEGTGIEIPMLTLDDFATDNDWITPSGQKTDSAPFIAIIKVDVEGLENEVLRGAQKLLSAGMVMNVFTESTPTKEVTKLADQETTRILGGQYKLHRWGYNSGPDQAIPEDKLSASYTTFDYVDDRCAKKKEVCNLWWKLVQ